MNVLVQCYVLVSMIIDIISTDMVWQTTPAIDVSGVTMVVWLVVITSSQFLLFYHKHCVRYAQIDWQVTKGGIQGAYEPTGNYFPTASNNLAAVDYTIKVVKAAFPERVGDVNVTERTPRTITLSALIPMEDNCLPVTSFQVVYSKHGTNAKQENMLFTLGLYEL